MGGRPGRTASWDVFISYRHGADRGLAPGLQSGLQRLAKPWYRPRALRVFRDETDLTASPDMWARIESALEGSQWLLLLASPDAARSPWVGREVERWLALGRRERLLVALIDGELHWDAAAGDWDWERTAALPPALRGAFGAEPLWADLRRVPAGLRFHRDQRDFFGAVARIASQVRGLDLAELVSQDYRSHARTMRLAWSAVALLAVLLVLAVVLGLWADRERDRAERQRRAALVGQSRFLAQRADAARADAPQRALLYALEAVRVTREVDGDVTPAAEQALRDTLAAAGGMPLGQWGGSADARFVGAGHVLAFGTRPGPERGAAGPLAAFMLWRLDRPGESPLVADVDADRIDHADATRDGRLLAVATYEPVTVGVYAVGEQLARVASLAGHAGRVKALVFSPDGAWLAVASDGPDVLLFRTDALDEEPLRLAGHEPVTIGGDRATVRSATFAPDGRRLVTHGWDHTLRLWDLRATPPAVEAWDVGSSDGAVAFSADGRWLVAAGPAIDDEETFHVIDLHAEHARRQVRAPRVTHSPSTPLVHPAGDVLAIVSPASDTVRTWETRQAQDELPDARELPGYLGAFSPDGRWLVTAEREPGGGHAVRARDVAALDDGPRTVGRLDAKIESLAFLAGPRGGLVVVDGDGAAWLLEGEPLAEREARTRLRGHDAGVTGVAVAASGRWLLTTSRYGEAPRLWPVASAGVEPRRRPGPGGEPELDTVTRSGGRSVSPYGGLPGRLVFAPDGDVLAVGTDDGTVLLHDVDDASAPPAVLTARPAERSLGTPSAVAYAPDGRWIAAARDESSVSLWRCDGSEPEEIPLAPPPDTDPRERSSASAIAVSADGRWVAAGGAMQRVHVWDTRAPRAAPAVLEAGFVLDLAFHPARAQLVASDATEARVHVWALDGAAAPGTPSCSAPPVVLSTERPGHVLYAGGGTWIATGGQDPIVRLWRSDELDSPPLLLRGHTDELLSVAASDDGRLLVTSSLDRTLRLWDTADPDRAPRVLEPTGAPALIVAVAPDARRIAAACRDGAVRLWSTDDLGRPPMVLPLSEGELSDDDMPWALRFDPGGVRLAGLASGEVRVWHTEIDALLDLAGRTTGRNLSLGEWDAVLAPEPYRLTVERWGLPPWFVETADEAARGGDPQRARALLERAVALAPGLELDPAGRATRLAVEGLLTLGRSFARNGERNAALATLARIAEFDPGSTLDPEDEVRRVEQAGEHVAEGERLARTGELDAATARFEQAFALDPGLDLDPLTEARRLHAPALLAEATRLARAGDVDAAARAFREAYEHDPGEARHAEDPIRRARAVRAEVFRDEARELARRGDVDGAVARFEEALAVAPHLPFEPSTEARRLAAPSVLDAARGHVARGEILEALAAFERAVAFDAEIRIGAFDWNELCWRGCQAGFAADVLFAGERAVELAPDRGDYRDTRGVARALTGDVAGAIEDFQAFVAWGREHREQSAVTARERWVAALEDGARPTTFVELEALGRAND